jgi:predicted RNase H-like HicB family nuclease
MMCGSAFQSIGGSYGYNSQVRSGAGRLMLPHYHINLFWSDEDGSWIADVPDLRSCSAHGPTPVEATREAQVAIELWLETAAEAGMPIPEPRYRPAKAEDRGAA